MSKVTYAVAPAADDQQELWKRDGPDDHFPKAVYTEDPKAPEGFKAMAAVLAPDEAVVEKVAQAIHYRDRKSVV